MAMEFVRYTPEIERLDPDLDQLLEQIVGFWEKKVRESPVAEGSGRAVRGAHAKTYGVVRAEVQILRNVPPAYARGIYATPGRHGALIRFSSASNLLRRSRVEDADAKDAPARPSRLRDFGIAFERI